MRAEPFCPVYVLSDLGRTIHQVAAGRARAERARHDMHSKFSRAAVAETVLERLNELSAKKRRLGRKGAAVQGGSREELRLLKEEPATERGAGEAQQRGSRLRGRKKEL